MPYCASCGTQAAEGQTYCTTCGKEVAAPIAPLAAMPYFPMRLGEDSKLRRVLVACPGVSDRRHHPRDRRGRHRFGRVTQHRRARRARGHIRVRLRHGVHRDQVTDPRHDGHAPARRGRGRREGHLEPGRDPHRVLQCPVVDLYLYHREDVLPPDARTAATRETQPGASVALRITGLLDNLWMLWDKRKQTIHDKVAKTVVKR